MLFLHSTFKSAYFKKMQMKKIDFLKISFRCTRLSDFDELKQ